MALAEDMGTAQVLTNLPYYVIEESSVQRIAHSRQYMLAGMRENPTLYAECRNAHADCISWAVAGECVKNAPFMKAECAPACMSCDYSESKTRAKRGRTLSKSRPHEQKKGSRRAGRRPR